MVGDIHGGYRALDQCLNRASFDFDHDQLICLGDVCDGWPEVHLCFDLLLSIKNLKYVLGNHDALALDWALYGKKPEFWLGQGGQATVDCYPHGMPSIHLDIIQSASPYELIDNILFVHGGIDTEVPIEEQTTSTFIWDRNLFYQAFTNKMSKKEVKITAFNEVYIGHTPLSNFGILEPLNSGNVWMMDTGAGWSGVLTLMDIESKQFYLSDPLPELYPGIKGRGQ